MFYKAGYIIGKYISMEMLIEKNKETFQAGANPSHDRSEDRKNHKKGNIS